MADDTVDADAGDTGDPDPLAALETFEATIADVLSESADDRHGHGYVAVFGVRELLTDRLRGVGARSLRVGVGGTLADRSYDLLSVPAVETELDPTFDALAAVDAVVGMHTSPLSYPGERVLSIRQRERVVDRETDELATVQRRSLFPFAVELHQPTLAEVLYLLAHLRQRGDYRGALDAGNRRAFRVTPQFRNHVAVVATNWSYASAPIDNLAQATMTALASRRTHGDFTLRSGGHYQYDEADLRAVVTARRPHAVEATREALVHAIGNVVPFGAMHGMNRLVGGDDLDAVVRALADRPALIVDAM